ncbi:MAG: helix-turn-helix transcriptional regulator [Clostridia bacterium]|nr:helix-turn-helix transcriptional regulator [Clostridia bacterium]
MNLRIAENIRRLRQEQNLTQAQLADRLGVSYQAISRWENETTYPDIELLPTIAALFGVTVDELLGSTPTDQKETLKRSWDKLHKLTDPQERVALLRQMHRSFPNDSYLFVRLCDEVPTLEEKRKLTDQLVRECPVPYMRSLAIRHLIRAEDEETVMERMYQYNIPEECWDELLEDRYRARGEVEKYRRKRQFLLVEYLRRAMGRMTISGTDCLPHDPAENEAGACTILAMIAAMTGTTLTEEHPVAGDGSPDLWASQRVWAGISVACAMSARGDAQAALTVLEDAANLLCRVRTLPDGAILSYNTPGLDTFDVTRKKFNGVYFQPDHMAAQFAHPAFDILRQDEEYASRFSKVCEVFTASAGN